MSKLALSVPPGGTSNSLSLIVFHSAGIKSRFTVGGAVSGLPVAGSNCITGPRVETLTTCLPTTAPFFRSSVLSTKWPLASVSPADVRPGFGLVEVALGWKTTTPSPYGLPSRVTTPDTGTYWGPELPHPPVTPTRNTAHRAVA